MEQIISYLREHRQQHLDELFQLVRFPSVSTAPERAEDVAACGKFLVEHLQALGMNNVKLMPTKRHPVVYAEWLEAPDAPTILIYGHYDVQPPEPLELWESEPFEPEIRDGEIYARGVSDDKGQFFAYAKAIEAYMKLKGGLPVNVKLLLEGEEEIGSENLHDFVKEYADLLKSDAILLSDTGMFAPGVPSICYGTRGLIHLQIDLETAAGDLHSGGFGGVVANPIQVLAEIIAALKDKNRRVTIPGFYDDIEELSDRERKLLSALPFDEELLKQQIGVTELPGEAGFSTIERRWARPTLDVNGILSGFTGKGTKTVIPSKAMAKITMRLVPNQDPEKVFQAAKTYIEQIAPSTAKVTVSGGVAGRAYLTPLDHPILTFVAQGIANVYDREPFFTKTGGTIGVLGTLSDTLQVPIVMVGLSYPNDNAHAPNEHMNENGFYTGIETAAQMLNQLKDWKPE